MKGPVARAGSIFTAFIRSGITEPKRLAQITTTKRLMETLAITSISLM